MTGLRETPQAELEDLLMTTIQALVETRIPLTSLAKPQTEELRNALAVQAIHRLDEVIQHVESRFLEPRGTTIRSRGR